MNDKTIYELVFGSNYSSTDKTNLLKFLNTTYHNIVTKNPNKKEEIKKKNKASHMLVKKSK